MHVLENSASQKIGQKASENFIFDGVVQYITDYVNYEVDKHDADGSFFKQSNILRKEKETLVTLEHAYDLFTKFVVAWHGKVV